MSKYYSTTIPDGSDNTNNQIEVAFEMARGTEDITIVDELLTTLDVAKDRAESTFLEQSYITKQLTVKTFHIDEVNIGDIVQIDLVNYKVIKIKEDIE